MLFYVRQRKIIKHSLLDHPVHIVICPWCGATGADVDIASGWHQSGCNSLANCKNTNLQIHKHKLVLGRHTLAARKPLSSYNDKGKAEHRELFGCLSVCHTLPTLSQDPSDTGYLLTLRLPDGSNSPPPPPSLPPLEIPPVSGVRGWIEAASSLT